MSATRIIFMASAPFLPIDAATISNMSRTHLDQTMNPIHHVAIHLNQIPIIAWSDPLPIKIRL